MGPSIRIVRPVIHQLADERLPRLQTTLVNSGLKGTIFLMSQSNVNTTESGDVCRRTFWPLMTTRLSALSKLLVESLPVRLHTINGNPVSRVRCSHSPFGPYNPGPHAAGDTRIRAPLRLSSFCKMRRIGVCAKQNPYLEAVPIDRLDYVTRC